MGATSISAELILALTGKRLFLHHGDGLGKGDESYKLLKKFFRSGLCQWLFARLHPNLGIGIANYWSKKSRLANSKKEGQLHADAERIWINNYSGQLKQQFGPVDFILMGHRHFPIKIELADTTYINLGEWVNFSSYAVFDGEQVLLKDFNS